MPQHLPAVTLKTGETMEMVRVEAPSSDWGTRLVEFMYVRHSEYTNCPWHHNCVQIMAGDFAEPSLDVFIAGLVDGEIVGTCSYAAPRDTLDLATFGRVVTAVPHRRKGISAALCAATVEDFRALGGWAMHLGTERTNPARFIYEALGFRHHNFIEGRGTIMRLVLRGEYEDLEGEYFTPDQRVRVRPLNWGDLARAELLYNLPHWFLKDYTAGVYANTPYEGQFFTLMNGVDRGETGVALETKQKRLVGLAYTAATSAQAMAQDHVRVMEFLVHPAYAEDAPSLIAAAAVDSPAEKLLAYASALDVSRCEALQEAGFVQEATLEDCLQDAESVFDLYVYSLSR